MALVAALTSDPGFVERDREYAEMRARLYQRLPVVLPGFTEQPHVQWRSPEIEYEATLYQRRMLGAQVKVSVSAQGETERAVERASRLSRFLTRHYHLWRSDGVFDRALFDQASLGIGVLHLTLDPDLMPLPPEPDGDPSGYLRRVQGWLREAKQTFFALESVDPATVYWDGAGEVWVQRAQVPYGALARTYARRGLIIERERERDGVRYRVRRLARPSAGVPVDAPAPAGDVATLYVVETPQYVYHYVTGGALDDAVQLGVYPNFLGRAGYVRVPGTVTGDPHPLYGFRPLLAGKYRTVPVKNLLGTALLTAGMQAAQSRLQLIPVSPDAPPLEGAVQVEIAQDGTLIPPPGYRVAPVELALGIDVMRALELINHWDVYGFPAALVRPEEVSAESGYDRARQQDVVASLLDPPLEKFGAALRDVFRMMATAIQRVGAPVMIRTTETVPGARPEVPRDVEEEITVDPADTENVDIRVSFDAVTLYSRIAMQEEGMKVRAAGLKTDTEFLREDRGIDDPAEWYRLRLRDVVRREAHERAVKDALAALDALRGEVQREAMERAGLPADLVAEGAGPAVPTGPGTAMPAVPPEPEELRQPSVAGQPGMVEVGP